MTFAETSQTQIAFVEEAAWGSTPATPAFQKLRLTGESLAYDVQSEVSNEMRSDATVSDLIRTGASASGELQFELSFGAADSEVLLAHALRGDFAAGVLNGGTARKSLTLEKRFDTGASDRYLRFTGCRVASLGLEVRAQQIVAASLSLTGKDHAVATAAITGATYAEPNAGEVMATSEVANVAVGGVGAALTFTQLSLTLQNNLRIQNAVGSPGAAGVGYGRREITGSIACYFEDEALYQAFVAGSPSSLAFETGDGTNHYAWLLPRIKYSSGRVVAGGPNQDVFCEIGFQALFDETAQTDIRVTAV